MLDMCSEILRYQVQPCIFGKLFVCFHIIVFKFIYNLKSAIKGYVGHIEVVKGKLLYL